MGGKRQAVRRLGATNVTGGELSGVLVVVMLRRLCRLMRCVVGVVARSMLVCHVVILPLCGCGRCGGMSRLALSV
jgi:hypothetical protein